MHTAHWPSLASFSNNNAGKRHLLNFQVIYNLLENFHSWLFFPFLLNILFHFWPLTKTQDIVGESVALQFYIKQYLSRDFTFLF